MRRGGDNEGGAADLSACSWPDGHAGDRGEDGLAGVSEGKLSIQKRTICLRQVGPSAGETWSLGVPSGRATFQRADVLGFACVSRLFTD